MDSDDDMHDTNDVDSLEDYYNGDTAADSDDDNDADYDFDNDSDEDLEAIIIYRYQVCSILDLELCFFFIHVWSWKKKLSAFPGKLSYFSLFTFLINGALIP